VIKHVSSCSVRKTNKIIIQNLNVHWFNHHYDLFFRALWTLLYVLKTVVASSQRCLAALICTDVLSPSMADGTRTGRGGLTQAVNGEIPS
jgi:hypothetical protein